MSSIYELEYYCKTDNPVGALLLTGKWGCGKTYLIENELPNKIDDNCVIIRISLFGIPTIEELHKAVKQAWIHEKGGLLDKASGLGKFKGFIEKVSSLIPNDAAKGAIEAALSFNLFDFIKIENNIDGKKVILVFDDLERSKLSIQEKLGAINEYCENQHFNVILVADEEKLNTEPEYRDFKEKIVQRTIQYKPHYREVVHSVICDVKTADYKDLLLQYEDYIAALFAGQDIEGNPLDNHVSETSAAYRRLYDQEGIDAEARKKQLLKSRPHNIRSLKTSIQDFERVFEVLHVKKIVDSHKWLFSFISFEMAARANLVHESERYGSLFSSNDVATLYPGFYDSRFLPDTLKKWIKDGVWDRELLEDYIDQHYRSREELSPKDQVRNSRIDYLEEEIAKQGLQDILQDAYDGSLSLNEYVFFVINSRLSRYYNLIDLKIDWDKVYSGINKRIEKSIQHGEKHELIQEAINNLDDFSEDEKKAYQIIKDARDGSVAMFEANKREYISEMRNNPGEAFIKVSNLRFNCFDQDMADATAEGFKNATIPEKIQFPAYFEGVWGRYRNSYDIDSEGIEKTKDAFCILKDKLSIVEEDYKDLPFKKRFTHAFIDTIDRLLADEQEAENEEEARELEE